VTGLLWAALGVLGTLGMTAVGDMVSEEIRDRLDHLPHAVLHLAARRLAPEQRVSVYEEEWLPELTYILKGDDSRPITRLYHGTRFSLGILASAGRISGRLTRNVPSLANPDAGAAAHHQAVSPVNVIELAAEELSESIGRVWEDPKRAADAAKRDQQLFVRDRGTGETRQVHFL
jgi:hypothetical protein